MEDIQQFIKDRFGSETVLRFSSIQRGDKNNKKGNVYERYYTIYQLVCITLDIKQHYPQEKIKEALRNVRISNSEYAFVDDLCIRDKNKNKKLNYQLKNSSTTGRWNSELELNFQLQFELDHFYYCVNCSEQVLVCSDEKSVEKNKEWIRQPKEKGWFGSEFFPYFSKIDEIIFKNPLGLKNKLGQLCQHANDNLPTALAMLNAVLQKNEDFNYDLCTMWEEVIEISKPNIFSVFLPNISKWDFPEWFIDVCKAFSVEIENSLVGCNLYISGFTMHLGDDFMDKLNQYDKMEFSSLIEFICFVLPLNSPVGSNNEAFIH